MSNLDKPCKVLKKYGISINRSDKDYKDLVVELCQMKYQEIFGCKRESLSPSSARTILAMIAKGKHIRHPLNPIKYKKKKKKIIDNTLLETSKFNQPKKQKSFKSDNHFLKIDVASQEFLNTYKWKKVRYEVLTEHKRKNNGKWICECCGMGSDHRGIYATVDHIKPRKYFPELALDLKNLQVLCNICNHGKGNWDSTDHR